MSLISAPAGFGKTDLLAGFAARCERPLAWVSLSTADSDPITFYSGLQLALQSIQPESGQTLGSALHSSPPLPIESLFSAFSSDIASIPFPFVLILDDLHLVNDERIQGSLAALLERAFPNLHLVVGSRVDPPFPLARLRAHGDLVEIRASDLRFNIDETAVFLTRKMGIRLSSTQIASLQSRTEGWIAGLQLAGVALQSMPDGEIDAFIHSFTGSHRYIMDYLTDEVLRMQPDWIEKFLLDTSILERLSASLCDALLVDETTPLANNQMVLEMIERLNLFLLPMDTERHWYRYHQLFSDLLRHRMAQRDPQRLLELHRRASDWFVQNAEESGQSRSIQSALVHAQASQDMKLTAKILDRFSEDLWQRGEYIRLGYWIEQLSDELRKLYPRLGILLAWLQFASGHLPKAIETLAAVENSLAASTHPPELQGKAAVVRAYLSIFSGNAVGIIPAAQQALELLPPGPSAWRTSAATALGDAYGLFANLDAAREAYYQAVSNSQPEQYPYLALNAAVKLVMLVRQAGELDAALQMIDQQLELAMRMGMNQSALAGTLLAVKGEILCERMAGHEARSLAEQGSNLCERGGHIGLRGWSTLALARVLFSTGDWDELERVLIRFKNLALSTQIPPWITSPIEALQGLLWLARGENERAATWAEDRALAADDEAIHARLFEYLVFAEYLLKTGQEELAAPLLDRVLQAAQTRGNLTVHIQALLVKSQLAGQMEDSETAVDAILQALKLAAPGSYIQTFIDAGEIIKPWLQNEHVQKSFPEYTRRLLAAFDQAYPKNQQLIEPLSAREIEVLQHIARGDRNLDIARELVISQNTVLFHTKNIFSKLNVNNRTQAIARARQLGLI